jgi:TonB family protein
MSISNVHIVEIPPLPTYGFVEVQVWIRQHTWRSLIYTVAALALLLLLYWTYSISKPTAENAEIKLIKTETTMDLSQNQEKEKEIDVAPPPDITRVIGLEGAVAGNPIPVPDIAIDAPVFASVDEIAKASSVQGNVDVSGLNDEDLNKLLNNKELNVNKVVEEIPDESKFIAVEQEPAFDLAELQKNVEYPEMARRAGIQGQVLIRVYIDKEGKPRKYFIQSSDSQMLNDAATKAVLKTVYTPAIQNHQPTGCWISIPIKFQLKNN